MPEAPRKPWDFFISYAREDERNAAIPLASELRSRGFEIWLDQYILSPDEPIEDKIINGLRNCHFGIVILSPHFIRKDWPKRELDTLLAIEAIDARSRIIIISHNYNEAELQAAAPKLARRSITNTSAGFLQVCDQILNAIITIADKEDISSREADSVTPFAHFRAIGILSCQNPQCSWKPTPEIMELLKSDPGPEFTLSNRGSHWYVVCSSCGTPAMGLITPEDAKELAALGRINLWAPDGSPYSEENDNG